MVVVSPRQPGVCHVTTYCVWVFSEVENKDTDRLLQSRLTPTVRLSVRVHFKVDWIEDTYCKQVTPKLDPVLTADC